MIMQEVHAKKGKYSNVTLTLVLFVALIALQCDQQFVEKQQNYEQYLIIEMLLWTWLLLSTSHK